MSSETASLAFVVIIGPQASGKSTLSSALAAELRRRGEWVALVELDQIAAMALPTLPGWDTAHRIFETVVSSWLRSELTCVVAESSGSAEEVLGLRAQAPEGVVPVTVATTSSFDVAFSRAQDDPTRGVSREHGFLSGVYVRWPGELAAIAPDLVIDTSTVSVDQGVGLIRTAIAKARARLA